MSDTTTPGARSSVMTLTIREKAALYASYMPLVARGGLFVPTTRPAQPGDSVYVMLQLMDDPARIPIAGRVVWVTPAGVPGRQQGIGVQFPDDDSGALAKQKIEQLVGGVLKSTRPTHTL